MLVEETLHINMLKLLILCLCCVLTLSEKVRYDNYTLYNVQPATKEHLQYLKELYKVTELLDFWSVPTTVENHVSVVSPPKSREEFEKALEKHGISYDIVLEDIQM